MKHPAILSTKQFRYLKKKQFALAIEALEKLDYGSLRLPDEIRLTIEQIAHDLEEVQKSWIVSYQGSVDS